MRPSKVPLIRTDTFFKTFVPGIKMYAHKSAGYTLKYRRPPNQTLKIPYVPTPLDIELVQQGIDNMKIYINTLTPADFLGPKVNEAIPAKLPNGVLTGGPVKMEYVISAAFIQSNTCFAASEISMIIPFDRCEQDTHEILVIKVLKNLGNEIPGSAGRRSASIPGLAAKMVDAVLRHYFSPRSKDKK